jgi:rRNA processing protein Gar1
MSKKEISWIGLINALIAERKKAGKPAGVKDVMGEAKKQWVEIKEGKDPKYVKGKQIITRKKGKKSKKSKKSKTAKSRCETADDDTSASEILDKCELCKKCMKEIKKHLK